MQLPSPLACWHVLRLSFSHYLRPSREEINHQCCQPRSSHWLPHRPLPLLHPLLAARSSRTVGVHEGHVSEVEQRHMPAGPLLNRSHGLLRLLPRRYNLLLRGARGHLRHRLHFWIKDYSHQLTLPSQRRSRPEILRARPVRLQDSKWFGTIHSSD